jgi:hypothetical protein
MTAGGTLRTGSGDSFLTNKNKNKTDNNNDNNDKNSVFMVIGITARPKIQF